MRAVAAGARDQLCMAVEQQRHVFLLRHRGQRLGDIGLGALVCLGEPQQHGGDVAGAERFGERRMQGVGVGDARRHQIEPRLRARFGLFGSRSHGPRMLAHSGGKLTWHSFGHVASIRTRPARQSAVK